MSKALVLGFFMLTIVATGFSNEEQSKASNAKTRCLDKKMGLSFTKFLAKHNYYETKDTKKGLYWAFKGAKEGSAECMVILFDAYAKGNGVVQDIDESIKWLFLAAAAGDKASIEKFKNAYKGGCSLELLQEGRKRAVRWQHEHPEAFFSPE